MGKGSSKAPAAPDPYATASAEAQFNRLDTYSPSGSGTRYGYTDSKGQFRQGVAPEGYQSAVSTVESPWERQIREILQPTSVNLVGQVAGLVDNLPEAARPKDTSQLAQQIFDAGYSRMAPEFEKENNRLLTNLQARGIPVGAEAFDSAYNTQKQSVNDALIQLTMGADEAARNEQSRQFGVDSAARQGAIAELVAAMGGGYNPPSASPGGNASGVDYSGLVGQKYQSDMAQWQQQQQNKASTMSTIGGLAGAMIMKCSVALKSIAGGMDTADLAEAVMHMPIQRWRYKPEVSEGDGAEHIGPMAQDFHRLTGLGDDKTIHVIDAIGVLMGALQDALLRIETIERCLDREVVH